MTHTPEGLNVLIGVFLVIAVSGLLGFVMVGTKSVWLGWFKEGGFFSSIQFAGLLLFIAFILSTKFA